MAYESSYDSGRKPFTPDLQRGYWASPSDFLFICWGFAFNFGVYDITYYFFIRMGIAAILPYMIGGALIVVPLMVILMYMGQFSSSGFISAFRISPLFKGIGLVSLFLNLSILTYYGLFGIVSLIYLFNSLRPTLPWSCEAVRTWPNISMTDFQLFCSSNETLIESYDELNDTESYGSMMVHVPSVAYFETFFSNIDFNSYMRQGSYSFSWSMLGCNFVLWTLIALVCYQNHQAEKLGRIIRYLFWVIIGLLLVCLLRFSLLPGAPKALHHFMLPGRHAILDGLPSVPITAFHSLGSGFGMLIALASHNRFRTNIMQYSWVICFGQCIIFMGFALLTQLIEGHFSFITEDAFFNYMETHWMLYLQAGSALAHMEWANFWSILYYLMLFLACLVVMLTQLLTVLTSVYDEFELLRQYKLEFRMALIGTLALISVFFCSNHGVLYFPALSLDAFFTKMLLGLLVLLVILWIYGRERFQHDIEFMLGQPFASWKVFLLRFIAPLFMGLLMIISLYIAIYEHYLSSVAFYVIAFFFILLPWLFVPGYSLMSLLQTTGSPGLRFKRICRPTDWYPLEAEDRQRYEEALGNMDITHQLHEVLEDVEC